MFFNEIKVPRTYSLIDTPRKLSWLARELENTEYMAFDIENNHPTVKSKARIREFRKTATIVITGISFAWDRKDIQDPWRSGKAAYLPLARSDDSAYWGEKQDKVVDVLRSILESEVPKCAQNGKFDVRELAQRLQIYVKNFKFDTMLAHSLLDEDRVESTHALKSKYNKGGTKIIKMGMSDKYLSIGTSQFKRDLDDALDHYDPVLKRYSKVPLEILYPYGCSDSDFTLSLMRVFMPRLEEEGLNFVFDNIVMPLSHSITLLELHGCPLDIEKAKKVEQEQLALQKELEPLIYEQAGREFLITSSEQLGHILFEVMKFPGGTRNKKGWVTDSDVLQALDHPIAELLLKYRRSSKIQTTYCTSTIDLVQERTQNGAIGWVHPNYWLDTVTGRLRCQNPNMTNLPRPENGGDIVKSLWVCEDDHVIVFKDFSQIELRVIAHASGEPTWVDGFHRGEDMHAAMAKVAFKLDCEVGEVKTLHKAERSKAKAINFGIAYGESIYSLAESLEIPYEEADKLINEDYFGAAPVLKSWIDSVHKFTEENAYIPNIFGRRRHLNDVNILIPNSLPWGDKNDLPPCWRKCVPPYKISVDTSDLHSISENNIKQLIRVGKHTNYFKCCNCQHLKSCFVNSEVKFLKAKKARALRQSVNSVIQGSAADMTSWSLIQMTDDFKRYSLPASPILYIHDEVGVYTHKKYIDKVLEIMEDCMVPRLQKFTQFRVPIETDTEIVTCWGDKT
ncbi:DNA polymerase [bacterium]|nr:DNA polymerase [bacterium]